MRDTGHRSWLRTSWLSGLVLLFGLLVLISGRTEEAQFVALLRSSKPAWLIAAAALQICTYLCAAEMWRRALARQGERPPLGGLFSLGLAKLFTDQAVPSAGLSGTLLLIHALKRRGIAREHAMGAVMVGFVAFYLAYAASVAAAVFILWRWGDLSHWVLALATTFAGFAALVSGGAFWLLEHPDFRLPLGLQKLPAIREALAALADAPPEMLRDPLLILQTLLLHLGVFLFDAATLFVALKAVGTPLAFAPVFAAFIVASVVATLMIVPGGIGTFEGSCVAMLHLFGIPLEAALAATLLLRGFTFWLPMAPGLWLARREMP